MEEQPSYDFPVVSVVRGDSPASLDEARADGVVSWEEDVYDDIGGDWKQGELGQRVGSLRLIQVKAAGGPMPVLAWFRFRDNDVAVLSGRVPGNGSWKGQEGFAFGTGTGKFEDRQGQVIDVESTNPKHWG